MEEEPERRIDLASKVAVLDERTRFIKDGVNRIEAAFLSHTHDEESAFHSFAAFKLELKNDLLQHRNSIDIKIKEAIDPLKNDMIKYKGIIGGVVLIVSSLWAIVGFFKSNIMSAIFK